MTSTIKLSKHSTKKNCKKHAKILRIEKVIKKEIYTSNGRTVIISSIAGFI